MAAVLTEVHDGWAELVLNRPDRKNAIEGELARDMLAGLRTLNANATVRAIVVRGAGGAFCSGLDIKAFAAHPEPEWKADFERNWTAVHNELLVSRKAIVVALERYAINGGAAVALAGDLMFCGSNAFLQVGEIQIGMAAPRNVAWLALRHSEAVMARICLLGDRIAADDLYRLGVATQVVDDNAVVAAAQACAQKIAGFPVVAVEAIKSSIRAGSAQMAPQEWFKACSAADPLAGAVKVRPSSMANVKAGGS